METRDIITPYNTQQQYRIEPSVTATEPNESLLHHPVLEPASALAGHRQPIATRGWLCDSNDAAADGNLLLRTLNNHQE